MYLRAMPNVMYFLDHSDDPRTSLLRRKELSVAKVLKHLKRTPIVPLIGDMSYTLLLVLRESPSFHGKEGTELTALPPKAKLSALYDLTKELETVRAEHNTYTATLKGSLAHLTAHATPVTLIYRTYP